MSNNLVFLHGYVGKDAEVKTTPGGQQFARFQFATSESWTDPQGEKHQKTEWHQVIAWGPLADRAGKYIKKGRELNLECKIEYHERKDSEGKIQNPPYTNLKLRDFTFCGKKDSDSNNRPDPEPSGRDTYQDNGQSDNGSSNNSGSNSSSYDDDIPF